MKVTRSQIEALREFVSTDGGAVVVLAAVQSTHPRAVADAMADLIADTANGNADKVPANEHEGRNA